jgi:hypothetical protein
MIYRISNRNVLSSFREECDTQFATIDEKLYTIENRVNSMKGRFKGLRRLIKNNNNTTRQRIIDAFRKEQNESMDMLLSLLFKKEWNEGNEVNDNEVDDNEVDDNEVDDNEVNDNEVDDNEDDDNEDDEVPRKTMKIEPIQMSFFDFDESSPFTLPKLDEGVFSEGKLQVEDVDE